jgi:hypothetical protein
VSIVSQNYPCGAGYENVFDHPWAGLERGCRRKKKDKTGFTKLSEEYIQTRADYNTDYTSDQKKYKDGKLKFE